MIPVNVRADLPEVIFAKNQPPYLPLPAVQVGDEAGTIITRWRMTWRERIAAAWRGDVYLSIMTFGRPLQPVLVSIDSPLCDS